MVSSNDMEFTKFNSMKKAAKATGVGEEVIRYVKNNGKDSVKKFEDDEAPSIKVFFIKLC